MSVGQSLKDFRLGKLRTADGKPVTDRKQAVTIGRERERGKTTITAQDAAEALAKVGKE